ncbi:unnamed protein product [Cylicocyclus nassatus]|uniref:Uncharacterized protein n=1 Tax=Cylicocyclus nassatus TaxID=53992 RepID=A0AA36GXP8_CYLNA|nr:unnamed protein product [Cylicocyclus nassatus]
MWPSETLKMFEVFPAVVTFSAVRLRMLVNVYNLTIGTLSVFGTWLQGTHKEDLPVLSTNLTDTHRGLCSCPTDLYNIKICPAKADCWNTTESVIYHATPDGQCTAYINCDHPPYDRLTMLQTDGKFRTSSRTFHAHIANCLSVWNLS